MHPFAIQRFPAFFLVFIVLQAFIEFTFNSEPKPQKSPKQPPRYTSKLDLRIGPAKWIHVQSFAMYLFEYCTTGPLHRMALLGVGRAERCASNTSCAVCRYPRTAVTRNSRCSYTSGQQPLPCNVVHAFAVDVDCNHSLLGCWFLSIDLQLMRHLGCSIPLLLLQPRSQD